MPLKAKKWQIYITQRGLKMLSLLLGYRNLPISFGQIRNVEGGGGGRGGEMVPDRPFSDCHSVLPGTSAGLEL